MLAALLLTLPLLGPVAGTDNEKTSILPASMSADDDGYETGLKRHRTRRRTSAQERGEEETGFDKTSALPHPVYGGLGTCTGAMVGGCLPIVPGVIVGAMTGGIGGFIAIPLIILGASLGAGAGAFLGGGLAFDLGHLAQVFVTALSALGWMGIVALASAAVGMTFGMVLGGGLIGGLALGFGVTAVLTLFAAAASALTYASIGGARIFFEEVLSKPERGPAHRRRSTSIHVMSY